MLRPIYRACRKIVRGTYNWAAGLIDVPVVVLIYHRVTDLSFDPQLLAVSPDNFHSQMRFLKENFPVLRFADDWSQVRKRSVAVTFDDGYADNMLEALPILEEAGVPATFFVAAGNIGSSREFWWDEMERILLLGSDFPEQFELVDRQFGKVWPTRDKSERHSLYQELHLLIKKIDAPQRDNWLAQLRGWAGLQPEGRETHRAMTLAELQTLAGSPLATIGAHTVTHSLLASQTLERQREELFQSKAQLEGWLNRKVSVFSYPFGGPNDYTHETVQLVKEAGFTKAASNFSGQWHSWTDPLQVPRQLVRNWDCNTFEKQLKRFWLI